MGWVKLDKGESVIPPDEAAKNREKHKIALTERTAHVLRKWKNQRQNIQKYDGRDAIWLNRKGNPYNSKNLNNLLRKLMDEAGIDYSGRKLVWYSIRKSTANQINWHSDDTTTAKALRSTTQNVQNYVDHPTDKMREIKERTNGRR